MELGEWEFTRRKLLKQMGRVAAGATAMAALRDSFVLAAEEPRKAEGPRQREPFPPRGKAKHVHVTARSNATLGRPFEVNVAVLDEAGAKAADYSGTVELKDASGKVVARHAFTSKDDATYRFKDIKLKSAEVTRFSVADVDNSSLIGVSNPILVAQKAPKLKVYWGDPHWHTTYSQDVGGSDATLEYGLKYCREVVNMDFTIPTDHDLLAYPVDERGTPPFNEETWRQHVATVNDYNSPRRFLTLVAYEWTSFLYGHKNVYTPLDELEFVTNRPWEKENRFRSPFNLWDAFNGQEVITLPHHVAVKVLGTNWDYRNDLFQPVVEIYSHWGNGEYEGAFNQTNPFRPNCFVQDALSRGHKLGFIAASDTHDARPNNPTIKRHDNPVSFQNMEKEYSRHGLTAVLAPELTRRAVFEALKRRRCYGTTGARIMIDYSIDGHVMGSEFNTTENPTIHTKIIGTAPISKVEVVKYSLGSPVPFPSAYTVENPGDKCEFEWADKEFGQDAAYYLRFTQQDGEMAWSSPIWVNNSNGIPR